MTYGDHKLGQGRENGREYLKQNPEVSAQLESEIRAAFQPKPPAAEQGTTESEAE